MQSDCLAKSYFIVSDDTLFGLKASFHINVSVVSSAILRKLLPYDGPKPSWKDYYLMRNHFFLYRDPYDYLALEPGIGHKLNVACIRVLTMFGGWMRKEMGVRASLRCLTVGAGYIFSVRT